MMNATSLTTVSGVEIDLREPRVSDIVFDPDIAEHLAKENRFNGATPGVTYSVAQHLVHCADQIHHIDEVCFPHAAAYALAHDFHEAYLKDDTTPKKRALDAVPLDSFGKAAPAILEAFAALTERFDATIHKAAGLVWPPPDGIPELVKAIDRAMLVTEWLQLRKGHRLPPGYEDVTPLKIEIQPMPWETAKEELLIRMESLLPVFGKEPRERGFG